jgi:hypothetical protein
MKKVITAVLALTLALILAGCSLFSPEPAEVPSLTPPSPSAPPESLAAPTVTDYFPFKSNVTMTYEGTGIEYAGYVSTVDYVKNDAIQVRTDNTGTVTVSVYALEDGALVRVFSRGETYYRQDFTDQRNMSEVILPARLELGTQWTQSDGVQCEITAAEAAVTVPYGSFTALEVTKTYPDSTVKEYYAKGIGLIKSEFTSASDPSFTVVSQLASYEEGMPAAQTVRMYYPSTRAERIEFMDETFELYTGDAMAPKLEDALKNPPADSGLAAVLSPQAAINSMTFDPENWLVTVDLNNAFLDDMRASGSSREGMVLECIANTVGGYYQTDRVQITIDGGTYESGHFLFESGVFLPHNPDSAVPHEA